MRSTDGSLTGGLAQATEALKGLRPYTGKRGVELIAYTASRASESSKRSKPNPQRKVINNNLLWSRMIEPMSGKLRNEPTFLGASLIFLAVFILGLFIGRIFGLI
jgi:hypothetical protein